MSKRQAKYAYDNIKAFITKVEHEATVGELTGDIKRMKKYQKELVSLLEENGRSKKNNFDMDNKLVADIQRVELWLKNYKNTVASLEIRNGKLVGNVC